MLRDNVTAQGLQCEALPTSHNQLRLVLFHLDQLGGEDLLRGRVVLHALGAEPAVGRHLRDLTFHTVVSVAARMTHLFA